MYCPLCRIPLLRRFRAALARLLASSIILTLVACDGATSPLAPGEDALTGAPPWTALGTAGGRR